MNYIASACQDVDASHLGPVNTRQHLQTNQFVSFLVKIDTKEFIVKMIKVCFLFEINLYSQQTHYSIKK